MLLIIAYIMNNERLNLSMVRNENSFSQYYTGSLISLNSLYMLEGKKDLSGSKKNALQYAGGLLVNGVSLLGTALIIYMLKPDLTETGIFRRIMITSRLITDVFLLPSTIWGISRASGDKDANYLKTMCGVFLGEMVPFAWLGTVLLLNKSTDDFSFTIFAISLFTLPPLGGVIGSNL